VGFADIVLVGELGGGGFGLDELNQTGRAGQLPAVRLHDPFPAKPADPIFDLFPVAGLIAELQVPQDLKRGLEHRLSFKLQVGLSQRRSMVLRELLSQGSG